MIQCLTSARFSMSAELLHWNVDGNEPAFTDGSPSGDWTLLQDSTTGEIKNIWTPRTIDEDPLDPDNPLTPVIDTFRCQARGVISQGVYASGSAETFGLHYETTDVVRMWVGAKTIITKRDRVTNIRDSKSKIPVFLDADFGNRPTVFNVHGVTPLFDGFNRHIQNYVLLERAPDE